MVFPHGSLPCFRGPQYLVVRGLVPVDAVSAKAIVAGQLQFDTEERRAALITEQEAQ